ncbi:ATP-binding cassette domain-containing protein [Microlunatus endophyticus]
MARSRLLLHVRMLTHVAPGLSAIAGTLAILRSAAVIVAMISSGRLVGALSVTRVEPARAWQWLAVCSISFVLGAVFSAISRGVEELISARYLSGYQDLLLDTAVTPNTVERLQSDAGATALDQAAGALQHWLFLRGVGGVWGMIAHRVAGFGALIIVAGWRWWIGLPLLAGWLVMSRASARWRSIVFDDTEQKAVPLRHRADYLSRLLAGRSAAKEIRLFGLADWLLGSYRELWRTAMRMVAGRRGDGARRMALPMLVLLLLNAIAFAVLITDAAHDRVSVASLTILVQAVLGMSALGRQDDDETSTGRTATELSRLVAFRSTLGLPFPVCAAERPIPVRASGAARIEIRGLRFGYPGGAPVLDGVDLVVEPGECLAVVGVNGAGKSTLLSLICGLWRPDAGTITIDGRDPITDPAVRQRIAPIFQSFLRLPLSAADNITAGNAWRSGTSWQQAAAISGADQVIAELPAGAATPLSGQFTGGTELSGGQWQRVALARAIAAIDAGAGILALDEPSAALDVRAEVALFDSVLRHRDRTTTLLITHRLSSVRYADRIVVLGSPDEDGGARVIEHGRHDELIGLNGRYAEMFRLQASRFGQVTR